MCESTQATHVLLVCVSYRLFPSLAEHTVCTMLGSQTADLSVAMVTCVSSLGLPISCLDRQGKVALKCVD